MVVVERLRNFSLRVLDFCKVAILFLFYFLLLYSFILFLCATFALSIHLEQLSQEYAEDDCEDEVCPKPA